jgi:hypothetical protein
MTSVRTSVSTSLSPAEVMSVLTDFGPERVDRWASIDPEHFEVHGSGPGWADVTEGNKLGWERTRYTWDADAGTVGVETLESNLWGPGSRWDYRIRPSSDAGTGSTLDVTLTRHGKGLKGKAIELLLPVIGARMIKGQTAQVFEKVSG